MKKKYLNSLLVFIIGFLASIALSYNFIDSDIGRKAYDVFGLILFFGLGIIIIKSFKNTVGFYQSLFLGFLGIIAFNLPYSLTHLPWQMIHIVGTLMFVLGFVGGGLFEISKSKEIKTSIIILLIAYSLFHFFFLHGYVMEKFVSQPWY